HRLPHGIGVTAGSDNRVTGCEGRLGDVDAHAASGSGDEPNLLLGHVRYSLRSQSWIGGADAYSSSVTCSPQVAGLPWSSTSSIARWVMNRFAAAPCQWSSPGSKKTRSPGRMTSIDPPRRWQRPTPSVTQI